MTEEEFYQLKPGDLVEYNGDKFEFLEVIHANMSYTKFIHLHSNSSIVVYRFGDYWFNTYTISDDKTLGNLKLIKKNSTIDKKISETKSEIEKLQKQLKELESEKNSKKIEQMISEMVPGNFYTIKYENIYYPIGKTTTGKLEQKTRETIRLSLNSSGVQIMIASIKDIIPREDLTNDYNKFMEKIEKYNQGEN